MEKNFYWYNVIVQFSIEDEKTGKPKNVKELYLIKAISQADVAIQVSKDMGTDFDFRILSVSESKIIKIIMPDNVEINM